MLTAFKLLFDTDDDLGDKHELDLARSAYENIIVNINRESVDRGYLLCNTLALIKCMELLDINSFELDDGSCFLLEEASLIQTK